MANTARGDNTAPPEVILVGLDGLAAAAVQESAAWTELLANHTNSSSGNSVMYSLRGRTTAHTYSNISWPDILQGGYDWNVTRQKPFPYFMSLNVTCGASIDKWDPLPAFLGAEEGGNFTWKNISYPAYGALRWFLKARPVSRLAFVYMTEIDSAGHNHGWYSPRYLAEVERAAGDVSELIRIFPTSVIIIVSDHGGDAAYHAYSWWRRRDDYVKNGDIEHSIDSPRFRDVPFAVFGPEDRLRAVLAQQSMGPICQPVVRNEMVMGLVSQALGVPPHPDWRPWVRPALQVCDDQNISSRYHGRHTTFPSNLSFLELLREKAVSLSALLGFLLLIVILCLTVATGHHASKESARRRAALEESSADSSGESRDTTDGGRSSTHSASADGRNTSDSHQDSSSSLS
jgi:Type I phosphodiesterase / nucleotide pyrophosphatase